MSDLQAALLGIGVVIIVAVIAYNKWQETKYREDAERRFAVRHEDALAGGQGAAELTAPESEGVQDSSEPRTEPHFPIPGDNPARHAGGVTRPAIDSLSARESSPIDYCVDFGSKADIDGSRVIESAVKELAEFSKAVHLEGYCAGSETWRNLGHDGRYSIFRGRIQVVDRRGAISAEELRRFDAAVRAIAAEVGAVAYDSSVSDGLARAKDLDRFCNEVDVQIGLNVVAAGKPFSGEQIAIAAADIGGVLGMDGAYHWRDAQGRTTMRLSSLDNVAFSSESLKQLTTSAVTFEFDIPRTVPRPEMVDTLFDTAAQFASRTGGKVVDDNHLAVDDAALSAIRVQLEGIHAAMEGHGFPAGEPLALRLFS